MQEWLIEPKDSYTNQVLAGILPPEAALERVKCDDGLVRECWLCQYRTVGRMLRSKAQQNLSFEIFTRKDSAKTARRWLFARPRRAAKVGVRNKNAA